MENIFGRIKKVMKDFLKIMFCKEKDIILGRMGEIIWENLIMEKKMELGDIYGLMEEFM